MDRSVSSTGSRILVRQTKCNALAKYCSATSKNYFFDPFIILHSATSQAKNLLSNCFRSFCFSLTLRTYEKAAFGDFQIILCLICSGLSKTFRQMPPKTIAKSAKTVTWFREVKNIYLFKVDKICKRLSLYLDHQNTRALFQGEIGLFWRSRADSNYHPSTYPILLLLLKTRFLPILGACFEQVKSMKIRIL